MKNAIFELSQVNFYLLLDFALTIIVPYSLLPNPYSLLPTPYSLLPTPYSLCVTL
ncbi:MAG: hypothetical protein F6K56_43075 [Moorea sp. SIO3G5]|nr:hypothetical protein [Moorena sp. SIO3G5]